MSYVVIDESLLNSTDEEDFEELKNDFLWPGLANDTVALIAGQDGVGKSYLALMKAIAVACSDPAADLLQVRPNRHGKVLMLENEDTMKVLRGRLKQLFRVIPASCISEIKSNLMIKIVDGCDDGEGFSHATGCNPRMPCRAIGCGAKTAAQRAVAATGFVEESPWERSLGKPANRCL